jgi:hypothetical protein
MPLGFPGKPSRRGRGTDSALHVYNRKTNLGYLVVFDGRIDLFGERLVSQQVGLHTVVEKTVDVRNCVNKKS